jgi:hypothetical protein
LGRHAQQSGGYQSNRDKRRQRRSRGQPAEGGLEISWRCAALPVLDPRTPNEILDYDEHGLSR